MSWYLVFSWCSSCSTSNEKIWPGHHSVFFSENHPLLSTSISCSYSLRTSAIPNTLLHKIYADHPLQSLLLLIIIIIKTPLPGTDLTLRGPGPAAAAAGCAVPRRAGRPGAGARARAGKHHEILLFAESA